MKPAPLPDLLTLGEFRKIVRVSRNTALAMFSRGEVKGAKKIAGRWRVPRATVLQLLDEKESSQ